MDGGLGHCTGDREQDHPQEKEMQNGCLKRPTNSCEKRSQKQRRKGKIHPFECKISQEIAKREKKAFIRDQCKEIKENN